MARLSTGWIYGAIVLGTAAAIAVSQPREVRADGGISCVDTCREAFGTAFTDSGYYYVLSDCGTSDLGTGRTWCMYVGTRL